MTRFDNLKHKMSVDYYMLDAFLLKKGVVRKPLRQQNHQELVRTVTQFEQMNKNQTDQAARDAVKALKQELGLA